MPLSMGSVSGELSCGSRVVGMFFSSILLGVYFGIVAILGGAIISYIFNGIHFDDFVYQLSRVLTINDLLIMFVKNFLTGLLIGGICTYVGLQRSRVITDIPQKNIKSVTYCAVSLILMNLMMIILEVLNSDLIGYIKYA